MCVCVCVCDWFVCVCVCVCVTGVCVSVYKSAPLMPVSMISSLTYLDDGRGEGMSTEKGAALSTVPSLYTSLQASSSSSFFF